MNKKLFLGMFAAAGMLFATSCSNDELDMVQSGNEAQVTFSLGLEGGIDTRAISDGKSADVLMYAVFDEEGNRINTIQKVSRTGVTFPTTENITLAKGQTYKVAFWAQDEDCEAYTVSDDMKVTVNYANDKNKGNNDETRDAFFKTVEFTVNGNQTIDVELKRPFAQINVGVYKTDWEAAVKSGIEIQESSVVIKNAATSINLLTGEVGDETTDMVVSYLSDAIPNEDLKVDLNGDGDYDDENEVYKWLSMSYILVADRNADTDNNGVLGDERATLESLQYTFSPIVGNDITFGDGLNSVPVQRNWRTNILGQLLTGDIEFNITINPIFEGDINVENPTSIIYATSQDELENATIEDNATIFLAAGEYTIPSSAKGKTLTIKGTGNPEEVKVAVKAGTGYENCDYGLDGSTVTFEGITITTNSTTYIGYARCKGTYKNCVINGTYTLYGDSKFDNCTFNVSGDVYNIWTWGAPNATFDGCTFNSDGKAMLLYGQANTKLTINNCTFNDNGGLDVKKAAIEIGDDYGSSYELIVNNTVVNGFAINDEGINTGTTLWANKNSMGTDKLSVTVDGVKVY